MDQIVLLKLTKEESLMMQSLSLAKHVKLKCLTFGLELEGFSEQETIPDGIGVKGGRITNDAGLNLCELITEPVSSLQESFDIIERLLAVNKRKTFLTPRRPDEFFGNRCKWQNHPRYDALRLALDQESPGYSHLVNQMTERAALHINLSGDFDAFGDEGAFLVNVFNDLAPFIAAVIHHDTGLGRGHLAIWQKFARAERLPQFGRWFRSGEEMCRYITNTPKLLKEDTLEPLPEGEMLSLESQLDLSTLWWFSRIKKNDQGETYLEIRLLPSMPIPLARRYVTLVVNMVEVLLDWFHGQNNSQPTDRGEVVNGAYAALRKYFPNFIPPTKLSDQGWRFLFWA